MTISDAAWRSRIEEHGRVPRQTRTVIYAEPPRDSFSRPVRVRCDDGSTCQLKGVWSDEHDPKWREARRALFAEQVVARIAEMIEAPTPPVTLIDLTLEATTVLPELDHLAPTLAHGSVWIDQCADVEGVIAEIAEPARRSVARLAMLFDLCDAHDLQLICTSRRPYRIYSVDHGHFFPDGCRWTSESLEADDPVRLYGHPAIVTDYAISHDVRHHAARKLEALSHERIAYAVAFPPVEWGVTLDERVAVAKFITRRRRALMSAYDLPLELPLV